MALEMRHPWIGNRFGGLLILGESHYGDPDDLTLTETVVQGTVDHSDPHRFFTTLEILITGEAAKKKDNESFWQTVAFANFCPGAVQKPRERPTAEMWSEGYRHFPALLTVVRPKRVLALGSDLWKNIGGLTDQGSIPSPKEPREVGRLDAHAGPNGDGVPIGNVEHPVAFGFSAREWRPVYLEFLERFPDA